MKINNPQFISSYIDLKDCPEPDRPEFAFIGRSNVGKSSLINMLCNHSKLAKTSGQPGKTQTINFFDIDETWYLVDLPGYGYARIADKTRRRWRHMINNYLKKRPNLQCAFLLIDSCIPPQQKDIEFANWMGANKVPFILVFTKTDRKKSKKYKTFFEDFQKAFLEHWGEMPTHFFTSAKTEAGKEEILDMIDDINQQFYKMMKK